MPTIPIRQLGAVGIIKDLSSFSLPKNGFSDGINVRFDNNSVQRAAVFRVVYNQLTGQIPVGVYGVYAQNSFDSVIYANADGRLYQFANFAEGDFTEAGHVDNIAETPFTFTTLAQCTYANRDDHVPVYLGPAMTAFATLPGWDSTWRCKSLRSFKNFLIALNITKGPDSFPNVFKWSDAAPNGQPPDSWDPSDVTRLAGENAISALRTPIVDGGSLGDNFLLYSRDECWMVELLSGTLLFKFRRLPFENVGLINQNCYVEVGGKHYAWSENDIYVHDGVTKKSIMDQRNRVTFFRDLNLSRSAVFFTAHDVYRHEIIFCGVSGAENASNVKTTYCNYGAVYNYVADTWSFMDLPNVTAAGIANANTVWTYFDIDPHIVAQPGGTLTYDTVGGTYFDQDDSFSRYAILTSAKDVANGLTVPKLLMLDGANFGKIALNLDTESVKRAWVQRIGMDLDEAGAEIRGYKHVRALMPQVALSVPSAQATVRIGGHPTSAGTVTWDDYVSFDPSTQYKIDTRRGGRYIAYEFSMATANDFEVSGYDLDVVITGKR